MTYWLIIAGITCLPLFLLSPNLKTIVSMTIRADRLSASLISLNGSRVH